MTSTESCPAIPADIAVLTGPLLLGYLFNWGLFGGLIVQTYSYATTFPRDSKYLKSFVALMLVLEFLQTFFITQTAYRQFGPGYGDITQLQEMDNLWIALPFFTPIISSLTQLFFSWRIWKLSRGKLYIPCIVVFLCLVEIVSGWWGGIYSRVINSIQFLQQHTLRHVMVWCGSTALCDMVVTIGMVYYLTRSKTGFRTTNTMLSKLVRLSVETGLVTCVATVVDISLFAGFQSNNIHFIVNIVLSKLYSNNLLIILNSRTPSGPGSQNEVSTVIVTSGDQAGFYGSPSSPTIGMNRHGLPKQQDAIGAGIQVHVSTETRSEAESDGPIIELKSLDSHSTMPFQSDRKSSHAISLPA